MSNPFFAPVPVYLPFSGNLDANGNITITLRPRAAFWVLGKIAGKVSGGGAIWEVGDGTIPLGFSRGQRAEIGGLAIPPGANIVLTITGGIANGTLTGSFQGTQSPDMATLAQKHVPIPNTLALDIAAPLIRLGDVSAAANQTESKSFPLPPGALAIGFMVDGVGGVGAPTQVQVSGNQTLVNYLTDFNPTGLHGAMLAGIDTSVTLKVISPVLTASHVFLLVWTSQAVVALNSFIENSPLPWQAANLRPVIVSANLTGGVANRLQLVGGVPGLTIRMFAASIGLDSALGAGQAFRLSDGDPNAAGTNFAEFESISTANAAPQAYYGAPLTSGNGLFIWSDANATVRGSVTVSQG